MIILYQIIQTMTYFYALVFSVNFDFLLSRAHFQLGSAVGLLRCDGILWLDCLSPAVFLRSHVDFNIWHNLCSSGGVKHALLPFFFLEKQKKPSLFSHILYYHCLVFFFFSFPFSTFLESLLVMSFSLVSYFLSCIVFISNFLCNSTIIIYLLISCTRSYPGQRWRHQGRS